MFSTFGLWRVTIGNCEISCTSTFLHSVDSLCFGVPGMVYSSGFRDLCLFFRRLWVWIPGQIIIGLLGPWVFNLKHTRGAGWPCSLNLGFSYINTMYDCISRIASVFPTDMMNHDWLQIGVYLWCGFPGSLTWTLKHFHIYLLVKVIRLGVGWDELKPFLSFAAWTLKEIQEMKTIRQTMS